MTDASFGQSLRQVDGSYRVGVTAHDHVTVFAEAFHDGESVTTMPAVPMMESVPLIVIPVSATVAALTLPTALIEMLLEAPPRLLRFCALSVNDVRALEPASSSSETRARIV